MTTQSVFIQLCNLKLIYQTHYIRYFTFFVNFSNFDWKGNKGITVTYLHHFLNNYPTIIYLVFCILEMYDLDRKRLNVYIKETLHSVRKLN